MRVRSGSAEAVPEFAYRKVALRGHFDHSKEILIQPRTREGELGYHVIVPLIREDGGPPILVNRGFVRRDLAERRLRPEGQVCPVDCSSCTLQSDVLACTRASRTSRWWECFDPKKRKRRLHPSMYLRRISGILLTLARLHELLAPLRSLSTPSLVRLKLHRRLSHYTGTERVVLQTPMAAG